MHDIIFEKVKGRGGAVNSERVFIQKQPSEGFFKKGVMRNFAKYTRKHLCRNLFPDKIKPYRSVTSLKTRL